MTAHEPITMDGDLPVLDVPAPMCGHCGNDVDVQPEGLTCWECRVEWPLAAQDGTPAKPTRQPGDGARCGNNPETVRQGWASGDLLYTPQPSKPCILPAFHDSGCLNPYDVVVTDVPKDQDDEE